MKTLPKRQGPRHGSRFTPSPGLAEPGPPKEDWRYIQSGLTTSVCPELATARTGSGAFVAGGETVGCSTPFGYPSETADGANTTTNRCTPRQGPRAPSWGRLAAVDVGAGVRQVVGGRGYASQRGPPLPAVPPSPCLHVRPRYTRRRRSPFHGEGTARGRGYQGGRGGVQLGSTARAPTCSRRAPRGETPVLPRAPVVPPVRRHPVRASARPRRHPCLHPVSLPVSQGRGTTPGAPPGLPAGLPAAAGEPRRRLSRSSAPRVLPG